MNQIELGNKPLINIITSDLSGKKLMALQLYTDNSNYHTKHLSFQLSEHQRELNKNDLHHYFDSNVRDRTLPKYVLDQLQTPSGSWKYDDYSKWYSILSIRKTDGMGTGYILFSITNSLPLYGKYGETGVERENRIMKDVIIFSYTKTGNRWKFTLVYSCFDDLKSKIINITSKLSKSCKKIYYTLSIKPNRRAMLLKWAYAHPEKTHFHGKDAREK